MKIKINKKVVFKTNSNKIVLVKIGQTVTLQSSQKVEIDHCKITTKFHVKNNSLGTRGELKRSLKLVPVPAA